MAFNNRRLFNHRGNYGFKKMERIDWWKSIFESEKQSLELGLSDAESGKLNPHSKVREIYEKWLSNSLD